MNKIRDILSAQWKYGHKVLYLAILISFSLIAYYNLNIGLIMSKDYSTWTFSADSLIKLNFNFYNYFIYSQTSSALSFFYLIPVFFIALTKSLFGNNWEYAFMILNLFLIFLSFIIFSKSLLLLKVRPLFIAITMPLLLLSVDLLVWPRYILSDTIFAFVILFVIYFLIKSIVFEKFNFFLIFLLIILILLTRPTSIPFVFAIIFFLTIINKVNNFSPKFIILIIFSIIILVPFTLAVFYQFMEINLGDNRKFISLIKMVQNGVIIHDRPETWIESPGTFLDLTYLYFVRFLFFFAPYVKAFSKIHIILNLLQALVIFFSIIVWIFLGEKKHSFNKTITLILLISVFVAAFHSFIVIDYDWRYRFPIIMPLLIIFPLSVEIIFRKISNKNF